MEKLIIITFALLITTNINAQTNIIIINEEDPFLKTISTPGTNALGPIYHDTRPMEHYFILDDKYLSEEETDIHVFMCPLASGKGNKPLYSLNEGTGYWELLTIVFNTHPWSELLWSTVKLVDEHEAEKLNRIIKFNK